MKDETATAMSYWKHNPTLTYCLEEKAHFYLQPSPLSIIIPVSFQLIISA